MSRTVVSGCCASQSSQVVSNEREQREPQRLALGVGVVGEAAQDGLAG